MELLSRLFGVFLVLHNINNKDVIIIIFKSLPVHLSIGSVIRIISRIGGSISMPKSHFRNMQDESNIEETIIKINLKYLTQNLNSNGLKWFKIECGVNMRSSMAKAILLLFVLTACSLGLALAAETIKANESTNATLNATLTNVSEEIEAMDNETLENETSINETLENETLINETLANETGMDSNPFANTKGRQPTRR